MWQLFGLLIFFVLFCFQDRAEEAMLIAEQKRRKEEEKGKDNSEFFCQLISFVLWVVNFIVKGSEWVLSLCQTLLKESMWCYK
jgi:predicted small integral membrane protein